jgi:heat shock protein HtpX
MQTLFERVRSNKQKTWFIFLIFFGLFSLLGVLFGLYIDSIWAGVAVSLAVALFYFFIVMASAESMLLASAHAKEVTASSHPQLYNVVDGMRISAGIPMPKVYVIEDTAMNAFATGRDPEHGVVVVTSGLLQNLNRRELEGVIAHEMSHIKNYDIRVMLFAAVLVGSITLLSDFLLRSFLWGGKDDSEGGGSARILVIVFALVLAVLAPLIAQLIQLAISRRREYLADADAAVLTRYPKGLANALKKIAADPDPLVDSANKATAHLYISMPFRGGQKSGLWHKLFSTHPPIEERIAMLEQM